MSAGAEIRLRTTLVHVKNARRHRLDAEAEERRAMVAYCDSALANGWKWDRIGAELGISGTGARRYYERNRRKVRGL